MARPELELDYRRYSFIRIWKKRYYHMRYRHLGRSTNGSGAKGKPLMSLEAFIIWCKQWENFIAFITIYVEWVEKGFQEYYSPSIDRINPKRGYSKDNIQWMPTGDNVIKNDKEESNEQ